MWREEPVWKDRGGDCSEAERWRERKPEKGIGPESGATAVSPVRDPGPPASGSGNSARAASPGMAWTCACWSPCLSVPLSVNALSVASSATAPLMGGGVDDVSAAPPARLSSRVSVRHRARHCGAPEGGACSFPTFIPSPFSHC